MGGMSNAISGFALKAVALLALLLCAWILFKMVLGVVMGFVWIAVVIAVVAGALWAMSVLKR
jgi:hypothetical protein